MRIFLVALALGITLGCSEESPSDTGDDGGEDPIEGTYCETLTGRLRACGSLGPGRFECTNYGDAAEECEAECVRDASCSELSDFWCSLQGATARCYEACIDLVPFRCDDGTPVPFRQRCDGNLDCPNGKDEGSECALTARFKCRNTDAFIDRALYCNGQVDCGDNSDELPDCDQALVCDGGTSIPEFEMCNGVARCADGADESPDCAVMTCG